MKNKYILRFLLASFAFSTLLFGVKNVEASIDVNLGYGATSDQVTQLQSFLISKGFLSGQPTGNFFGLTRAAVKAYQLSVGVPSTGYVGPLSRAKINIELSMTQATSSATSTVTTSVAKPVVSTTLCNGVYYSSCPLNTDLVCPASGAKAYCQPSQPPMVNTPVAQQPTTPVTTQPSVQQTNNTNTYQPAPTVSDSRFLSDPYIVYTHMATPDQTPYPNWNIAIGVGFTGTPFVDVKCISSDGTFTYDELAKSYPENSVWGLDVQNGLKWGTDYACRFTLTKITSGTADSIQRYGRTGGGNSIQLTGTYRDISFSVPAMPSNIQ